MFSVRDRIFSHYLSYGSTDQQTVRELSSLFDGLLIPGTIAAFQAEGTRGFVLSLSARSSEPYVIDSRFPLFQNRLSAPKKSHLMLADVLGAPELVRTDRAPLPSDFDSELIDRIVGNWIDFNSGFDEIPLKAFDKYAARLGESVLPEDSDRPAFVLPPYVMVTHVDDGWAGVGQQMWDSSVRQMAAAASPIPLARVIAADSVEVWSELSRRHRQAGGSTDLVAWISGLDEFSFSHESKLYSYGEAIAQARQRGQKVFALYGGFFSVLLARCGLSGASHGIGFGEHRTWVELPSSGAPPARYYVPRLHKYIGVDVAETIWRQFPELIRCSCDECRDQSPASLDYHGLMKHSVRARSFEIDVWAGMTTREATATLNADFEEFRLAVSNLQTTNRILKRAEESYLHLAMWSRIMVALEDNRFSTY